MKKIIKRASISVLLSAILFVSMLNGVTVFANLKKDAEAVSDSVIIPDKFNTGAKGDLEIVPEETVKGNEEGSITFMWRGSTHDVNVSTIKEEVVVIENKKFTHGVRFLNEGGKSKKIIFKNCSFESVSVGRVGLENWEIVFENCSFKHAFGSNMTFHHCYFGGSVSDGLNPFQNVKVYDSFFSDLAKSSPVPVENKTHSDATQMYGYTGMYKGEEIVLDVQDIYFYNCRMEVPNLLFTNSAGYVNAALMIQPEYSDLHDVKFEKCIINGGGYSIYISAKNNRIVRDLTLEDVKVGSSAWYGELYKGGVAVPTSLFPERNIIYHTSKTDKLYVGSVWKEEDGVHISVTNDTDKERILTVELADGTKKYFPIKASYPGSTWWNSATKYVEESRDKYTYEDFPFDIELVVEDTSSIRCYDENTLIRTQKLEDVITRISLDKNNSSLRIGETKQLKVETFPIEDVQQQFIWSSSNEEIVKVDQKGHIKALGQGESTITVKTQNGLTASIKITVNSNLFGDIDLDGNVNLNDIFLMLKHSVLFRYSPISILERCDSNHNGRIDIIDFIYLVGISFDKR